MSLVADYSSSSSSISGSDDTDVEEETPRQENIKSKCINKPKLPSANQLLTSATIKATGDVFNNPFREAENAKIAVLEKHVKMVSKDEHLVEKNGRKICWNYRKGRCRFGSKCSFAHDSDISTEQPERSVLGKGTASKTTLDGDNIISKPQSGQWQAIQQSDDDRTNAATISLDKKRKRPGLSDSVVPSKKVLKSYMKGKPSRPLS